MTQVANIPQYPAVQQTCLPAQPNYNAVKIDIINPSVNAPSGGTCQAQPTAPIYNYPQAPVYNYPQAPVYTPQPSQQQAPVYYPVPQPPKAPESVPDNQGQIINNGPNAVPVPVTEQTNVPAPEISKPEVKEPEEPKPQVDLNAFLAGLTNPDFDVQLNTMESIPKIIKQDPKAVENLVDTKVFDALNNILNVDTSKLEKPSQQQEEAREKQKSGQALTEEEKTLANSLAPKELADRNKCEALYSIAMLDKVYSDAMENKNNAVTPLTDLPLAVQMVDQLKDNPEPIVRSSAIESLSYLQRPEYKNDLNTLFSVAQSDSDAGVVQTANEALAKLNNI